PDTPPFPTRRSSDLAESNDSRIDHSRSPCSSRAWMPFPSLLGVHRRCRTPPFPRKLLELFEPACACLIARHHRPVEIALAVSDRDRKSTRLNSSHVK